MKYLLAAIAFGLFTSSAYAKSEKICFGTGNEKGTHFVLTLTTQSAKISEANDGDIANESGLNGEFPFGRKFKGRDGLTYLAYDFSDVEGQTDLIVSTDLLKAGSKGYAKIRWSGEGFEQSSYFCRDNK